MAENRLKVLLQADSTSLNNALYQARMALRETQDELKAFGNQMGQVWTMVGQQMDAQLQRIAMQGDSLVREFIAGASQIQMFRAQLKALVGTYEEADRQLQKMQAYAAKTPFDLPGIVQAGIQLRTFRQDVDRFLPVATTLATVAGRSVPEAALALGKALSGIPEGVMMLQESFRVTRSDLIAYGAAINAQGEIANKTVRDMERLRTAVETVARVKFGDVIAEQAKTLEGGFSNLNDLIGQFKASLGDQLAPAVGELTQMGQGLMQQLNDLDPSMKGVIAWGVVGGTALTKLAQSGLNLALTMGTLTTFIKPISDLFQQTAVAQSLLNAATIEGVAAQELAIATQMVEEEARAAALLAAQAEALALAELEAARAAELAAATLSAAQANEEAIQRAAQAGIIEAEAIAAREAAAAKAALAASELNAAAAMLELTEVAAAEAAALTVSTEAALSKAAADDLEGASLTALLGVREAVTADLAAHAAATASLAEVQALGTAVGGEYNAKLAAAAAAEAELVEATEEAAAASYLRAKSVAAVKTDVVSLAEAEALAGAAELASLVAAEEAIGAKKVAAVANEELTVALGLQTSAQVANAQATKGSTVATALLTDAKVALASVGGTLSAVWAVLAQRHTLVTLGIVKEVTATNLLTAAKTGLVVAANAAGAALLGLGRALTSFLLAAGPVGLTMTAIAGSLALVTKTEETYTEAKEKTLRAELEHMRALREMKPLLDQNAEAIVKAGKTQVDVVNAANAALDRKRAILAEVGLFDIDEGDINREMNLKRAATREEAYANLRQRAMDRLSVEQRRQIAQAEQDHAKLMGFKAEMAEEERKIVAEAEKAAERYRQFDSDRQAGILGTKDAEHQAALAILTDLREQEEALKNLAGQAQQLAEFKKNIAAQEQQVRQLEAAAFRENLAKKQAEVDFEISMARASKQAKIDALRDEAEALSHHAAEKRTMEEQAIRARAALPDETKAQIEEREKLVKRWQEEAERGILSQQDLLFLVKEIRTNKKLSAEEEQQLLEDVARKYADFDREALAKSRQADEMQLAYNREKRQREIELQEAKRVTFTLDEQHARQQLGWGRDLEANSKKLQEAIESRNAAEIQAIKDKRDLELEAAGGDPVQQAQIREQAELRITEVQKRGARELVEAIDTVNAARARELQIQNELIASAQALNERQLSWLEARFARGEDVVALIEEEREANDRLAVQRIQNERDLALATERNEQNRRQIIQHAEDALAERRIQKAEEERILGDREAQRVASREKEQLDLQGRAASERLERLREEAALGRNVTGQIVAALREQFNVKRQQIQNDLELNKINKSKFDIAVLEKKAAMDLVALRREEKKAIDEAKKAQDDKNKSLDDELSKLQQIQQKIRELEGEQEQEEESTAGQPIGIEQLGAQEKRREQLSKLRTAEKFQKRRVETAAAKAEAAGRPSIQTAADRAKEAAVAKKDAERKYEVDRRQYEGRKAVLMGKGMSEKEAEEQMASEGIFAPVAPNASLGEVSEDRVRVPEQGGNTPGSGINDIRVEVGPDGSINITNRKPGEENAIPGGAASAGKTGSGGMRTTADGTITNVPETPKPGKPGKGSKLPIYKSDREKASASPITPSGGVPDMGTAEASPGQGTPVQQQQANPMAGVEKLLTAIVGILSTALSFSQSKPSSHNNDDKERNKPNNTPGLDK